MRERVWELLIQKYKDENGIRGFFVRAFTDIAVGIIALVFISIIKIKLY